MPREGENIYKRKDGRWEGRYIKSRNGSKTLYGYIYGKTYRDVKEKLLVTKSKLQHSTVNVKNTTMLFSACAEYWLTEKEPTIKYSTFMKYTNLLNSYIIPALGSKLVNTIGYDELSEFCSSLLTTGGKDKTGLSPKITLDCLTIVKAVIKYASRKKCNVDTSAFEVSIKLKNNKLRVLTVQEQEALLSFLRANPTPINTGIMICLFTGIRIGELCALKWEDISFESKTISISKTLQRVQTPNGITKTEVTITAPKSECSVRQIPIPDILLDYLLTTL